MVGPVYLGCKAALQHLFETKTSALFTHVLSVAADVAEPEGLPDTVVYHQIAITEGVQNIIGDHQLWQAVEYIRTVWREFRARQRDRRLLVCSRLARGALLVEYKSVINLTKTIANGV